MYKLSEFLKDVVNFESDAVGGLICTETDANLTFLTNRMQGALACYSFTIVCQGWLKLVYNGREMTLQKGDLYTYTPGFIVTILDASPDYHGICLIAEENLTLESPVIRNIIRAAYFPLVELSEPKQQLSEADAQKLCQRMLDIIDYQQSDHKFREDMLRLLYAAFLLDLLNIQEHSVVHHTLSERTEELFLEFIRLLPHHFVEHHDIGFYADKLCITPIYLSRIVKKVTGRTVVDYINQMLLMEASWLLQKTNKTTKQIAEYLHFSTQANFSRFFTRLKGVSPKVYRMRVWLLFVVSMLLSSCYQQESQTSDAWNLTEQQLDSISFYTTHHYTQNYNFLVKADTLWLIAQHPTEAVNGLPVDSLSVARGDRIVVADITHMPADERDSIWVKVARDQQTIGWVHEQELLPAVRPDAPISQFIDFFSDTHMLIFLAILALVGAVFVVRRLLRLGARLVFFNDIGSFYPTLLCLFVATTATFYSTIQLYAPDSWRHYYYHPTLNPFAVPLHLSLFLLSVWAMLIVALATVDDVLRQLKTGEALVYFLGLAGVCAISYVVFTVSTLYYVGYPLLVAYFFFAFRRYCRADRPRYLCGNCGEPLPSKGVCPHCGAVNE